jgi:4-carboxymuconolactone decarboxylase
MRLAKSKLGHHRPPFHRHTPPLVARSPALHEALPRTIYQFIVLTVARATGAGFEWHDHIAHARAAGLPADVIDCIGSTRTTALPQPYALAHAILEKTMAWQIVPDDLQAQAVTQWGKRGLVEIVVLSGFYQMFAAINQGFDIRPAPKPA